MSANVYCPFCGVVLLADPYDPASPQTRVRPWYAEVRGVYSTNTNIGYINITGVGVVRNRNYLYAPLTSSLSYVDLGIEGLDAWRLCAPSENSWCFGFHNSCWRLLLLMLGRGQDDSLQNKIALVDSVFYQLYCTPCLNSSWFQFGHDYQGAAQTHKSFGLPKPVDLGSHFYADPFAIPSMDDLEATAPDFLKAHDGSHWKARDGAHSRTAPATDINYNGEGRTCTSSPFEHNRDQYPSPDGVKEGRSEKLQRTEEQIFDRLSPELVFEIFSYLSFSELLDMRLVCRHLALLAKPDTLPQSYWRSRFLLGQEADFLFPNLTDTRDWRRLFFGTRASLSPGLVNRKRIRQLLEPIAALVGLETVLRNGPSGSAVKPARGQGSYFQLIDDESAEKSPQFIEIISSFAGQLASIGVNSPLDEGCRVLHHMAQSLIPPRRHHRQRIGISTVQIGARNFISGINLFPSVECNVVDRVFGYRNPASETWIEIPSTSHINAVCVAFCSEGLTGIQFMLANSDSSGWIGNSNGPGIAQGTLAIPEGFNWYYLVAGLDRYKIVSLGLGELTDHAGASPKFTSQCIIDLSCVQSHLWTPHPPEHEDLRISFLLPSQHSGAFEPLTNIDFGGPRGLFLRSLARVVFYMASYPRPLIGIEIFYSDGRSALFGSNRCCGISFFVNGSNGERINRISALGDKRRYYPSIGLGGLQVSTNHGRTAILAPLHYRLDASIDLIPISPGYTITGFAAVEEPVYGNGLSRYERESNTRFIRIGLQSQQCDEQDMTPVILDRECHQIPDDQLRYDLEFSYFIDSQNTSNYQTYASLKNIRKIQASTGIRGRSRSPSRVSGLKLEYYNDPHPSVVGQWMNELDAFALSPDEEVRSLTTWLTPSGFSSESPGMEVGQVAAIRIETTLCRSVTFCSPDFHSLPPKKLQHQYQSASDEKLTAISWILNASSDCVRAVVSSNGTRRTQILVPKREPPFDQVRKLYFEMQNDDSCRETIVTAEAYFRDRVIIGLVFVYASGTRASIGDFDTDMRQTVHFAPDDRIVGFSVAGLELDLMEIELEVEQNDQPRYEKLRHSINSSDGRANAVGHERRMVWCKDEISAESNRDLSVYNHVYKPPSESRLVGIYVGCQRFSRIGALYEPEGS